MTVPRFISDPEWARHQDMLRGLYDRLALIEDRLARTDDQSYVTLLKRIESAIVSSQKGALIMGQALADIRDKFATLETEVRQLIQQNKDIQAKLAEADAADAADIGQRIDALSNDLKAALTPQQAAQGGGTEPVQG